MQSGEAEIPTGNGSKTRTTPEPLATGLRFERGRLVVILDDDREVSVPLSHYPTLQNARQSQRAAWRLIGPGRAFYWESLDLDLSVRGIVSGLPEVLPAPPSLAKQRVSRATRKSA